MIRERLCKCPNFNWIPLTWQQSRPDTGRFARRTERSQKTPIDGWGRRDPGNGPIGLLRAKCGTKPNSDQDHGGFAPVHSVQRWAE
jgi:hypothetical protein